MHHAIVFQLLWIWYTSVWYVRYVTIAENYKNVLVQNAVTKNPQKNFLTFQVQMDQICQIATQNMPNNFNKCQTESSKQKVF